MYHCGMRQMEEKHIANQVELMVWSNRLDLLALSNFKGEVQVHRLRWQKVWNLTPPKENDLVCAMAWRPDGKALAIGYSSGYVYIVDIEDKEIINKFQLTNLVSEEFEGQKTLPITCITWPVRAGELDADYNIYDDASIFIQKPSSCNGYKATANVGNNLDIKEVNEQKQLNVLLVGYGPGYIHMSIFGRFSFGTINLTNLTSDVCSEYKILDIILSDDFSVLQVLYVDKTSNNLYTALINTCILSAYAADVCTVANKHAQVVQLLSQLDQTMTSISEAWEHILLEMDSKMADYAASLPEGGVSADFLELLMMGVPSYDLELFLLRDLTTKGLKKFGSSVELSYSTIQKLVLKQLNIVGQSLTYYLSEIRGITRIPDRYKILDLEESVVNEAIRACFAFLNKCLELQQVIDVSMRNYKAFFRWLFVVIVRLLDEQTPSDIVKITQQELSHIAEFLYNFYNMKNVDDPSEKPVRFNLERLGQYLQNQNLTVLPDNDENPWHKFLKENPCIMKETENVFSLSEFKKYSLTQQQNHLKTSVHKVFEVSQKDFCKHFSLICNLRNLDNRLDIGNERIDNIKVTQMFDVSQQRFMAAYINKLNKKEGISFMFVNMKEKECSAGAAKYYFTPFFLQTAGDKMEGELDVLDLQFYSSEYLSVLLSHPHNEDSTIFIQLPLRIAMDNSSEINIRSRSGLFNDKISKQDISPLLDQGVIKVLEEMDGNQIAVSGGRKVAVVLSKSNRKVRVFEMEVDGEDDDDETLDATPQSHNTTQKSDNSHIASDS